MGWMNVLAFFKTFPLAFSPIFQWLSTNIRQWLGHWKFWVDTLS